MTATQRDTTDIVQLIIQDHRDFERAFAELERHSHTAEYRKQLVDHVIADLVRHSVAEEQFLYPTAKDNVEDGEKLVTAELKEHADAERLMKDLEGLNPGDPKFEQLLSRLIADVRHHIDEEERELLPKVKAACSPDDLDRLGRTFEAAKQAAPTRPHPAAPDEPPANLILGPGAGLIDKVRDALTGRQV